MLRYILVNQSDCSFNDKSHSLTQRTQKGIPQEMN